MKALKIIGIVVVVLFGGYSIWMATIDAAYHAERKATINSCSKEVIATVSDLRTWEAWSAWINKDSTMVLTYSESPVGEGAWYSWTSENMGGGKLTITSVTENRMEYDLAFEGMGQSKGYFDVVPTEGGVEVTMGLDGESPFFTRVFNLMMDDLVGPDFDTCLAKLQPFIAKGHNGRCYDFPTEVTTVDPMTYYFKSYELGFKEISEDLFASTYGEIASFLGKDMAKATAPPLAIFNKWDEANERAEIEIGLPVASDMIAVDPIRSGTTYGGKVLKVTFRGNFNDTGNAHWYIDAYLKDHGLVMAGSPWESYVTDPEQEPDSANWITEIYYPIQ